MFIFGAIVGAIIGVIIWDYAGEDIKNIIHNKKNQ